MYAERYEQHVIKNQDKLKMRIAYWLYAFYYGSTGQYDKEIEAYINALEIVRKYKHSPDFEAGLLTNIGSVLYDTGQIEEALSYFEQGLAISEPGLAKANMLYNTATIYKEHLGNPDTAQIFFEEALEIYEKENDLRGLSLVLMAKGNYEDAVGNFEIANSFYSQALQIIDENELGYLSSTIYGELANHYSQRNMHFEAIQNAEQSIEITKKQGNNDFFKPVYRILHENYAALGNHEKAYEVRGEFMTLKDSISSKELRSKVEELQTKFEVEQKERDNELLKAEQRANQKTIQSRSIAALAFLLGLLLVGSWGIAVYRSNRQKQKYNQQLEHTVAARTIELQKANEVLRAFNYVASHDIKEPIRNVGSYAGLIYTKLPDDLKESFKTYFDTIQMSTSQLYTLVEDFSYYTNLSKDTPLDKQKVHLDNLVEGLKLSFHNYKGEIVNRGLPVIESSSSFLFAILKNIIENGLKFNESEIPKVELSHQTIEGGYEIIISDNGIGIDKQYHDRVFELFKRLHYRQEYDGSGIGLAIVKLLLEKIGGQIEIESEPQKGSKFKIFLPQ